MIEPFDKQILEASKEAGNYNFLTMCKNNLNMQRYLSYNDLAERRDWGVYETVSA